MIPYRRHDLVWLSDAGKEYALRNNQNCIPIVNEKEKRELIFSAAPVPAIVRRQESTEDDQLCIGFSSHRIIDGVRLRIGSKGPLDCIVKRISPFEAAECKKGELPCYKILEALLDAGARRHIQVGCFGSAALQLVTGLPYFQKNSDMDIYLRLKGSFIGLELFFQELVQCEKQSGITIDAEIEYGEYGVKLKELLGPGKTVLGKGLYDVALLEKGNFPEL